jgi:hypothetical protein
MQCLSFFAALALVLCSTQSKACQNADCADTVVAAECNSVGCVRSTNSFKELAKSTEHTLSVDIAAPRQATRWGLCGTDKCVTEWAPTPLSKNCVVVGRAIPEQKVRTAAPIANDGASIHVSTRVADAFAAATERHTRVPPAVPWAALTERWGYGGLYKAANAD